MKTSVKVIADSECATRLTTLEACFPRIILPEVLTHRMFSRNTSSSRATKIGRNVEDVTIDTLVPEIFLRNQL